MSYRDACSIEAGSVKGLLYGLNRKYLNAIFVALSFLPSMGSTMYSIKYLLGLCIES